MYTMKTPSSRVVMKILVKYKATITDKAKMAEATM
jgi:hypothetical protein